ncbi:MAG: TonB-dependent receptor [Bacteroidales bacterium]|nr:TonB-dependent receptor [Bacteroidales bacterium]
MISSLSEKLFLIGLSIMLTVSAMAQSVRVNGVVYDAGGAPVVGAAVFVEGTTVGAVTDASGTYSLSVSPDAVLEVSCLGYVTQTVSVGGRSRIDITLEEDTMQLDETVVVGYGVQKKSDVTGAISSLKSSDLENRSVTSVVDAMAGKTAGVNIISTGGSPGESGTMIIRGYSSNRSSHPLYVVDGLRVRNINNLDPNTIESIEVLKDASSAAIYGAEAGNGVIMVTTKKGAEGTARISYEGQLVLNDLARVPAALNAKEYVDWLLLNKKYTQNDIDATIQAGLWDGRSSTDWIDVMTERGMSQRHTLSVQAAAGKATFYASLGYTDQNGIVVGDYDTFKRLNATLNVTYKVKPWLELGNSTNFSHSSIQSVAGGGSLNGSFFGAVYWFDPTVRPTYSPNALPTYMQSLLDQGKVILTDDDGNYYGVSQLISTNPGNPLATLKSAKNENKTLGIQGTAYATFTPSFVKGLVYTSRLGYRINQNNTWGVTRHYYAAPDSGTQTNSASVRRGGNTTTYYQWENFVNYSKTLGGAHDISAMVGMSYSQQDTYNLSGSQSKLRPDIEENPLFWDLAYATSDSDDQVTGTHDWERKLSYYGRANYSYKNRYNIQFTFRADAADLAILSKKNRWGYFPAVSGGWTISNEDWFPKNTPVEFVKLRASWGQNGSTSSLSNYSYATTIATTATGYSFDGSTYTVSATTTGLSNEDLKWETSEQLDFGLDLRFLKNRLTFGVDWYRKTTKDLILSSGITVPAGAGANAPVMNGGSVLNRGWEFELSWRDKIGDFGYNISANFSTLHNEVTEIQRTVTRYTANSLQNYGDITAFEVGHPVWYLWTYHTTGIDKETGEAYIDDTNGDGQINVEDKIEAGSGLPDYQYGITATLNWKNWDFRVFGQGVGGNQIFRATGPYQQNTIKYFYDRTWTPEKKSTATMSPMNISNYSYYVISDAYVFNADYFKIKQIQLGYSLPKSICSKISLSSVRFSVSLEDWFIITPYKAGMDPSISANNTTGMGVDYGAYPNYKKTMFGINVTF